MEVLPHHFWQMNATLSQCNKVMLQQQIQCDVTFRVGRDDDAELVPAHRYVLISRSPVFYVMFCGSLQPKQNEVVEIPDVDAQAFKEMLKFLYYEEQDLDLAELGLLIMYCAKKYMVPSLLSLCVEYLKSNLNTCNALLVYEQSLALDESTLISACLQYICANAKHFFDNFEHFTLSREAFKLIIQADALYLPETSIYNACVQWSRMKCEEAGTSTTKEDMRSALGDIVNDIRFPLMSVDDFSSCLASCSLLKPRETEALLQYFSADKQPEIPFNNRARHWAAANPARPCFRFRGQGGDWDVSTGSMDAIEVECDSDILLHGVLVYQGVETGASHEVTVQVQCKGTSLTDCNTTVIESDGHSREHTVYLTKPIVLTSGKMYTIMTKIMGSVPTYRGCSGRHYFRCNKVGIKFHESHLSANGTSVEAGQIPGILFSII